MKCKGKNGNHHGSTTLYRHANGGDASGHSLSKPEDYILAMVEFHDDNTHRVHCFRQPFQLELAFGVMSVNYDFPELLEWLEAPG
ncbi:MAG: hypothetical protein KKF30_08015 [Proteobacteria bacterium]|nr:hypothetical protein [Pseudomonadota bacterium]MBU4470600.1 hypothetical protein [Pseudomonadota bacterium]MCG2753325.1 hypothetical protein [Desulfobacteraceae bacterium]